MHQKINVGIWGLGNAGRKMLIPELQRFSEMFEIKAGYDVETNNLKEIARDHPEITLYSDQQRFLKDPEVELVVIATRSIDHVPHALEALHAGKRVLLEKPIAISEQGADQLQAALEQFPEKLYFRHNKRWEPQFQCALEWCKSGRLGEVYEVKLHRHAFIAGSNWQTQIDCGGGYLNNWGPHIIDHALIFLGSKVRKMWSNLRRMVCQGDAEDHARIILEGENGRMVELEVSCGVALAQPEYVIFGDRGSLICKGLEFSVRYLSPDQDAGKDFSDLKWIEEKWMLDLEKYDHPPDIWKYLYSAIRKGETFPISSEQAIEIVRICCRAKEGTPFQYPTKSGRSLS